MDKSKKIRVGGQFSGVGAFDQALNRLGIKYENVYQAEWDKYARLTYLHNYEKPTYYVEDVNDTPTDEITEKYGSLDLMMFSPPCQAFSLAGKRKGEDDDRGVLFYNSHEFIKKNKPRYFIFENVKGLLSDDNGRTFQRWVAWLGGRSVNGVGVLFAEENAVPYHLYYSVLNAKDYGVPQNRERVFLVGIRDDEDNHFRFPKEERLEKRLKDVLEDEVDEKYYLSDKMIEGLIPKGDDVGYIQVKSATKKGYEEAQEGDSVNLEFPDSETRRGRVGKQVAQTLDTGCNQGVILGYTRDKNGKVTSRHIKEEANTIHLSTGGGGNTDQFVIDSRIRRLSVRECFRLMDFPDTFDFSVVSDTQAYKQAGNSIVVSVLEKIINNLK
jgi:DNA (cytosine-5)-methyltransferase 1